MTNIIDGPKDISAADQDGRTYRYRYVLDDESEHNVEVSISGSLNASDSQALTPVEQLALNYGRPALEASLAKGKVPKTILLSTLGVTEGEH